MNHSLTAALRYLEQNFSWSYHVVTCVASVLSNASLLLSVPYDALKTLSRLAVTLLRMLWNQITSIITLPLHLLPQSEYPQRGIQRRFRLW
jgi:hypothetical protein